MAGMAVSKPDIQSMESMVNHSGFTDLASSLAEQMARNGFSGKISVAVTVDLGSETGVAQTTRSFSVNFHR